jgi:single-stranded DNA-specific DHH superfamily exonuclease
MKIKLLDNDSILILHHWDCDGICSSILLEKYLKNINPKIDIEFFIPKIGNYFLDDKDYKAVINKKPDILFIIDMALPKKDILKIEEHIHNIFIFDHHKQQKIEEVNHINPFTESGLSSLDIPSCGWVINNYFNQPQEILAVLGAIGDQEDRVKENSIMKKVIKEYSFNFKKLAEIVKNIDSCYILNNLDDIQVVRDLLFNDDIKTTNLDMNKKLRENRKKIKRVIKDLLDNKKIAVIKDKIILKEINTDYHIISDITRLLSKKYKSYIIIVVNYTGNSKCNLYFRTKRNDIDLYNIIDLAIKNGYKAGGKKEVAGIILPEKDKDKFINNAIELIN